MSIAMTFTPPAVPFAMPITSDPRGVNNREACQIIRQAMASGMLAALHGESGVDYDPNTGRVCAQGAVFQAGRVFLNKDLQAQFVGMHDHWGKVVNCYGRESPEAHLAQRTFVLLLDKYDPPTQPHEAVVLEVLAKAMDTTTAMDEFRQMLIGTFASGEPKPAEPPTPIPPQPAKPDDEQPPKEKEPTKNQAAAAAPPSAGGVRQKEKEVAYA